MPYNLEEIMGKFDIEVKINEYGNGHINDTYLFETAPRYILQRINSKIFIPEQVMENIVNVTNHLAKKIKANGGDVSRETLTVIKTLDGKNFYKTENNDYFRLYKFIEDSVSYDIAPSTRLLMNAGRAFGKFQKMLADFPAETLHETIENFHNTPVRLAQLREAIENDSFARKEGVKNEIDFALKYGEKYAGMIVNSINDGLVPIRVTHNDTKLNNVLFDRSSDEGVCVIDLDTVMSGSILYDFGDALRFGASSAAEDEKNLEKVYFDLDKFNAFASGFVLEVKDCLTEKEKELMPVSALILTYECGIRFLTDYINGDKYFKTHYKNHNLDRAKNQFKLVQDIELKLNQMSKIINEI